jgi:hypothetical protein
MQFTSPLPAKALGSLLLAALPAVVTAQDIVRHAYDSGFPIAAAVEVPAGKTLVYLGGTVPQVDLPAVRCRTMRPMSRRWVCCKASRTNSQAWDWSWAM